MILLLAVVAGLLVGLVLAGRQKVKYEAPTLRHLWLVFVAFLPQYLIVSLPARGTISNSVAALCLIFSQLLLLSFAMLNQKHQGMKILMIGTALNFTVMLANSGFMPISPQTAGRLVSQDLILDAPPGSRFGPKDILLPSEQTHLEWLADRFLPPIWFPYQVAFSLGDVFIAAGVFWLLALQNIKYKDITHDRSICISTVN